MNWEQIRGQWKDLTGRMKTEWGRLTDDDISRASGNRDQLAGALMKRYGYEKEEAKRRVDEWVAKLSDRIGGKPPAKQH